MLYYLLHEHDKEMIEGLFILLLALQLYYLLYVSVRSHRFKRLLVYLPIFLASFLFCLLSAYLNDYLMRATKELALYEWLAGLAWWVYLLYVGAVASLTVYLIYVESYFVKHSISHYSLKESADGLPGGLCFATADRLFLTNHQINRLSCQLCGQMVQDLELFWICLQNLGEPISPTMLSVQVDDRHWTFSRKTIQVEQTDVIQLTAWDSTEFYEMNQRLARHNQALQKINDRLQGNMDKLRQLARQEELLAIKINVHEYFGHLLLNIRRAAADENHQAQQESLLAMWQQVVAILKGETNHQEKTNPVKFLQDAGQSAGVEISLVGELPGESAVLELVLACMAEALPNAVRHGDATKMQLRINKHNEGYEVMITNNGKVPKEEIVEAGGLGNLRHLIECAGGQLMVYAKPTFCMIMRIDA